MTLSIRPWARFIPVALCLLLAACSDSESGPNATGTPCGGLCPAESCFANRCVDDDAGGPDLGDSDVDAADPDVMDAGDADDVGDADDADDADAPDMTDTADVPDMGCESDDTCGDGQICVEGDCIPGCRDDDGCAQDQYCDTDSAACVEGCRAGECPEGQVCDLETRTCLEVPCDDDDNCDRGQICEDGACQPGCRDDDACDEGEICTDDLCVEGCRNDESCPEAEYCDLDALACEPGCRVGGCPEGEACDVEARECAVIPCENDDACALGQICEDGACLPGCREDAGCDDDEICTDDTCVVGCRTDRRCGEGQICEDALCADGCRNDAGCTQDEICVDLTCGPGCRGNGDCGQFEACVDNVCETRQCDGDQDCVLGSYCAEGTCEPGCRSDVECAAICGADRTCQDGCRFNEQCEADEVCVGAVCVGGCRDDDGCEDGQICSSDNECVAGCRNDGQCQLDDYCSLREPSPTEGVCAVGCRFGGCPRGQICSPEIRLCEAPAACEGDADCGDGQLCLESLCRPGCREDGECLNGQICSDGNLCAVGCRDDEFCGPGTYCDTEIDLCRDGCRGDEECGPGLACVSGDDGQRCGPAPCEEDGDCSADFFCGPGELCSFGCRPGGCPDGLACDIGPRVCVPEPCQNDDACADGEVCLDGNCLAGCRDDEGCAETDYCGIDRGEDAGVCREGCRIGGCGDERCDRLMRFCTPSECTDDNDCEEDAFCRDQIRCALGCRDDDSCGDGEICEDVERVCTAGCRDDADNDDVCAQVLGGALDLPLNNITEVEGTLCLGEVDHVSVRLEEGEQLVAGLVPGDGLGELFVELLADDCESVLAMGGFEDDPNQVGLRAPATGVYVLRVTGARDFDSNSYTLSLRRTERTCLPDSDEPNDVGDGTAPVFPVERGQVVERDERTICFADEDWFAIPVDREGDAIFVTLHQDADAVPLRLELRTSNDVLLDSNEERLAAKSVESGPAPFAGVYFLRIAPTQQVPLAGVDYTLQVLVDGAENCREDEFEPNDTSALARTVPPGTHALNICQARDDMEWFRFEVAAGDFVDLSLRYDHELIAPEEQLATTLYGPGGAEDPRDFLVVDGDVDRLAFNPDGFIASPDEAGFWFVSVASGLGDDRLDAELDITVEVPSCDEDAEDPGNQNCGSAQRIELGTTNDGFVCGPASDEDWFVVTPDPDGGLLIELAHFHFDGNLELEAYADQGNTLVGFSYNAGPNFETIELDDVPDGDICIRVFAEGFQVANDYTLRTASE